MLYEVITKNGEIIEKFVSHEVEPNSELIVCLTGDVNEMSYNFV